MPSRRSPSLLSRLATAFVCLLAAAGAWVWLSARPVKGLDSVFYRVWENVWGEGTPASRPVLLGVQEIMPLEKVPRRVLRRRYPEVAYAILDEEQVAAHFHQAPIQPLDFAVLLHETRKAGFTCLGISSPWGWSSCDPLVQETLRRAFRAFPSCVLGLRGRTASRPEFTPAELAGGALDSAKITGSIAFLPSANASLPHALANWGGGPFAPWAIDWVEGERLMEEGRESGVSYPLLVRWHGDIYPTLPLRLLMLAEGVQPGEVRVEVGSHIAWRDTRLPLDSFGRTTLDAQCRTRLASLPELMESDDADSAEKRVASAAIGGEETRYLLLCEPVLSQPGEKDRAEWMAATLSQLACRASERTEWTTRPVAGRPLHFMIEGEETLAVALGVGVAFLLVVPGRSRAVHSGAEALVVLLALGALGAVIGTGRWVPVAPWAAALAVLFAGGRALRLRQPRRRP